jgi:hypothetical protein
MTDLVVGGKRWRHSVQHAGKKCVCAIAIGWLQKSQGDKFLWIFDGAKRVSGSRILLT